jgi:acyl-coenzyme A synthetase/AMP-(fatty) acid ligase
MNLPMSYTYGLSVVTSHLAAGASVMLDRRSSFDPGFWTAASRERCTSFHGVPAAYELLRQCSHLLPDLPTLSSMTQSGGTLAPETTRWLMQSFGERSVRIHKMYGMTEATARICVLPPERLISKITSVGLPVPGGRIEIAADGEVIYHGPNVMMGYAEQRLDLTRADDLGGILRTSDIGWMDEEGFVSLQGRRGRICKIFGVRLNLDEVEAQFFAGRDAAICSAEGQLIVFHDGQVTDLSDRLRSLSTALHLPPQCVSPRRLLALPRLSNGKYNYAELKILAGVSQE